MTLHCECIEECRITDHELFIDPEPYDPVTFLEVVVLGDLDIHVEFFREVDPREVSHCAVWALREVSHVGAFGEFCAGSMSAPDPCVPVMEFGAVVGDEYGKRMHEEVMEDMV